MQTSLPHLDAFASSSRKILVVEDDRGLNLLMQKKLRRAGFHVDGVFTGTEALQRIFKEPDMVLLLDQRLPDMEGEDVIVQLQERGHTAIFVAMTGQGDEKLAVKMMKLGARDYLTKDLGFNDLLPEVFQRIFRELETEQRLISMEQQLNESLERHRLASEAVRDGIWDWDFAKDTLVWNSRCYSLLGYEDQAFSISTESWRALMHPEEMQATMSYVAKQVDKGEMILVDARHKKANGQWLWVQIRGRVVEYEGNRPLRLVGTLTDVTERKKMEKQLSNAIEHAEAASKAKSVFLANMSHEIRTPLNGVMGMLCLLQDTALNKEQKKWVNNAYLSTTRLTGLLADILDLSRVEAGQLSIENDIFTFEEQKKSILGTFLLAAQEKGVGLHFYIDPDVPTTLLGDAARLRQILFNLVGNAVKFTDVGQVTIDVSQLPSMHSTQQSRLLITVCDTGIGIDEDSLAIIFDPFSQVEGDYTRRYQGAGLGLSIVKRLVSLVGGSLCLSHGESGGTIASLSLPIDVPEKQNLSQNSSLCPPPCAVTAECKILVAEDDSVSQLAIRELLQKRGHKVVVVDNGQKVLEELERQEYDIIFMDIQMPVMDGLEATKAIRSSTAVYANIPIVATTAYAMAGDKERFMAAGMSDYVTKPVDLEALEKPIMAIYHPVDR